MTGAPTAILVDDESALLGYLKQQLQNCWPELRILDTAQNGREALGKIRDQAPDIVFLDIKMPGLSGLDVARELSSDVRIVFVTAYDNYAVEAFDSAALDYVLKPVSAERLAKTVERLKERLQTRAPVNPDTLTALLEQLGQPAAITPGHLEWLKVGTGDEVQLIASADLVYLRSDHKYTSVFTADAEHVIRMPLTELEAQLNPERFWRVHRGIIVAVNEIASAKRDLRGRYTLTLRSRAETLRTSSAYKHLFAQM